MVSQLRQIWTMQRHSTPPRVLSQRIFSNGAARGRSRASVHQTPAPEQGCSGPVTPHPRQAGCPACKIGFRGKVIVQEHYPRSSSLRLSLFQSQFCLPWMSTARPQRKSQPVSRPRRQLSKWTQARRRAVFCREIIGPKRRL